MPERNEIFQSQTPMTISRATVFIFAQAEELLYFQKEEICTSLMEVIV